MRKVYLDVGGKWGVVILFGYSEKDYAELYAVMDSFGMKKSHIEEALEVLSHENTGLSISRSDLKMSAVFISKATEKSQFWNTLGHELWHVSTAIIDYYGVDYEGEPAAYLYGHLLQRAVEEIAEPCV